MKRIFLFIFLFLTKAVFAADFVVDSFTDSDNTPITSHTPEAGGPWTIYQDSGDGSALFISSSYLWLNAQQTGSYAIIKPTGTPQTSEYDLAFTISVGNGGVDNTAIIDIRARWSDGSGNGYVLVWHRTDETWRLLLYQNGSPTELGTFVQTLSSNTSYDIVFQVRNSSKKVIFDSTEQINSSNNSITGVGAVGITIGLIGVNGSVGPHFNSFTASDFSGAPPSNVIVHRVIQ